MKNHIILLGMCLFVASYIFGGGVSNKPMDFASTFRWEVTSMPPVSIYDLPEKARNMVTTYFGVRNVVACQLTHCGKRYLVRLTDKRSVFFDEKGQWLSVDCRPQNVPDLLIPSKLRNQIAKKYGPYEHVVKMTRKKEQLKVQLSNGVRIIFDL